MSLARGYGLHAPVVLALARLGLWRKLGNYLLAELELRRRARRVRSRPYWVVIDPSSACDLECPFCPTGKRKDTRERAVMSWEHFKAVIDELGPTALHVEFTNWGEPTLNKDLPRMVRYAKTFGLGTHLSTHMNRMTPALAGALVESGLDWVIVSIDGASPETYAKYRVGGDYDAVIRNLKAFLAERRSRGSATPHVHWQFLVFRHNEHETVLAEAVARFLGVDEFGASPAAIPDPAWVPVGAGAALYPARKPGGENDLLRPADLERARAAGLPECVWPWLGSVVNANGSVSPCCAIEDEALDYGRADAAGGHAAVWNGEDYRAARAFLAGESASRKNACTACPFIGHVNIAVPGCWVHGAASGRPLIEVLRPRPFRAP